MKLGMNLDAPLSHEIEERWTVYNKHHGFKGEFYNSRKIGEISGSYDCDTLSFMTCHFKSYGGPKIGEETLARAILFGHQFAEANGVTIRRLYKYYLMSPNDHTVEDWCLKGDRDRIHQTLEKINSAFRRLGFSSCRSRCSDGLHIMPREEFDPMDAEVTEVLGLLKSKWGGLFYRARIEALGGDWTEAQKQIDWDSAEREWMKNYRESRKSIQGLERVSQEGIPVNIRCN